MTTFEELADLAKNAANTPLPDDYADQLTTAYLQGLESHSEKISQLETALNATTDKLKVYAVENFDLTRKARTENDVSKTTPETADKPVTRMTTEQMVAKMRRNK